MISQVCTLNISDDELSRWHDDDLAPARTALIRAHTASCPHCRERLATYEEIGAGLRALQPPALDLERLIGDVHEAASSTASVTMQRGTAPLIPARIHHRSQRMMTGTAGLAAVLVLSLLAGWIFTTHGRPFVGDKTMNTPLLIPREDMPLRTTLIDMSSATDGWAIASKSANGDTPLIVLHYTNGRWTRVLTHMQGKINALKVLSATNGWAIGDHIYHYDGRTWQEVFAPGQNKEDQYETIAVAAPSSVWITSQNDSSQILYFDGSAWTWQNLPSPATRGLLYNQINSISMTSGHEGWAVARMSYMAPSNAPYPLSVVLHYADGVWSVDRTCQQCELTTVSAVSPSVVWIGGSRDTSTGPNTARLMPLLWQLSDGNWRDVPIPNSFGRGPLTGQVGRIQMLSTTEGWMIANVGDAVAGGAQYNPLFYLKNRQWVETSVLSVPIPTVGMALAFVSSSEFWGLGEYGISHYLHGVWKNVVA